MENFSNYIVNISNLKHNFKLIKSKLKPNVKICAMVKADAYGHGLKDVCKALNSVDFFGVASVYEANKIRKFDAYTSILVVGTANLKQLLWCSLNNVSVEVSSVTELNNYIKFLDGQSLKVHIKVNTGLNGKPQSFCQPYKLNPHLTMPWQKQGNIIDAKLLQQ